MIATLDVKGFKSIRNLHLDCRRINLFIGEPNTGKSNILEALGFLSWCGWGGELREYVRFATVQNLFYDGIVDTGCWHLKCTGKVNVECGASFSNGQYQFAEPDKPPFLNLSHQGQAFSADWMKALTFIRHYRPTTLEQANWPHLGGLMPPQGRNLVAQVYASKELRQLAADYFTPYGLRLVIKPHENAFEVQKQTDGVVIGIPFHLASDTLQRMIFYRVAMESNKDSTLVFEEPEAHAFPYYTKHLGERIALDENGNQYFIATHNPYLLTAIVEKAPAADLAIFATYYRDYETRVRPLTSDEIQRLFEADPFFTIEHIIEAAS